MAHQETGRWVAPETMARRGAFELFRTYEDPWFNLCAEVRVGESLAWCRARGLSFSRACWFACLRVADRVEQLRYRMRGDRIWAHDHVGVATTILNEDGESFSFCHFPYAETFEAFCRGADEVLRARDAGVLDDRPDEDGVLFGSTLPWVRFTSVSHARRGGAGGERGVPKIVLGRFIEEEPGVPMPVALEIHHALADGLHAGRFFAALQDALDHPERELG